MSAEDHVDVPLSTLRGISWSIAVIVVAVVMVLGAMVIKILDDHQRCLDGNEFRREDLPAAFALHDRRLGQELGADENEIDEFTRGFESDLRDLFPARDCALLG